MDPKTLRDHLIQLRAELSAAPQVDPGSQRLLGEILEDIQRLVARSPDERPGAAPAPVIRADVDAAGTGVGAEDSLPDRLEKIALLFEIDHPTLAASSRRLIDLLGKVGL